MADYNPTRDSTDENNAADVSERDKNLSERNRERSPSCRKHRAVLESPDIASSGTETGKCVSLRDQMEIVSTSTASKTLYRGRNGQHEFQRR